MSNLCTIPARAGSKRIPGKNFKEFLGKPMICYAIETALKSNLFRQIIVSTDSSEIMNIVDEYSEKELTFLQRLPENALDTSTTMDVINEVLDFDYVSVKNYDRLCCLYPCTPLLTVDRLKEGYRLIKQFNSPIDNNCSMSVIRYGHPIYRAWSMNHDGSIAPIWHDHQRTPTNKEDPTFYDAGQFYWSNIKGLKDYLPWGVVGAVEIPESECQDIDNEEDWKMAEIKYKYMLEKGLL